MWEHLCTDCVRSVFGVRAGFDAEGGHIFPRGVLSTVTLMGGVPGIGRERATQGVRQTSSPLSGRGGVCSQGCPEGRASASCDPFKCVVFLLLMLEPLPKRKSVLDQVGLMHLPRPNVVLFLDVAQGHVFSPAVVTPDLVQGCGMG